MTFNFYIKDKSKAETQVRLVVRHKGQTFPYYTSVTVAPSSWSARGKRVLVGNDPAAKQKNAHLKSIIGKSEKVWRTYLTECMDYARTPTFGDFTGRLKNELDLLLMKKDRADDLYSPKNFIPHFIESRKELGDVSPGTIKKYKLVWRHLQRFEKENHRKLTFHKMDVAFAKQYKRWRFDQGKAINTVWKELATTALFLAQAHEDGYNPYTYHKHSDWNVKEHAPKNLYLTFHQAEELYYVKGLPSHLRRTVDEFTCAIFSGIRFSDFQQVMNLDKVGQDADGFRYFVVDQTKTSYQSNIPLHPMVEKILQKYGGTIPPISGQKTNDYLKEAAKRTSWGNDKIFLDDTSGGKVTTILVPRWQAISTHTARRSFATNMYAMGVPKQTIMKITGHRTEESFDRYIQLNETEHAKIVGLNKDYIEAWKRTV